MEEMRNGSRGVWAAFGLMLLIALVAWGIGATGLALVLAIGASGSVLMSVTGRKSNTTSQPVSGIQA